MNPMVQTSRKTATELADITITDRWWQDLMLEVESDEKAFGTAQTYRRGLQKFLQWLQTQERGDMQADQQTIRRWCAHLKEEGHNPAGIAILLAGVRHFFRWAVGRGYLPNDPTTGIKAGDRGRRGHKRDPLTDMEVLRLLEAPQGDGATARRDRAILYLMAYTGARTIEVLRAKVKDLQTGESLRLWVWGKGRREADTPLYILDEGAKAALYDWLAVHPRGGDLEAPLFCSLSRNNYGKPLSPVAIRTMVKGYYKQVGIRSKRKTTHSLRHTVVTNMLKHGAPPVEIMSVTRHASLDTLLLYAHEVDRDVRPPERYIYYR